MDNSEFGAGPLESEPYRSLGQCFHTCGHFVSAAAPTSVHCARRVSELPEQPINATCRPSFVRIVLVLHYIPSTDIFFKH